MKHFVIYSFAMAVLIGCKSQSNRTVAIGKITAISSLRNISLGQNDTVWVTFNGGTNGCAQPHHLEVEQTKEAILIKAYYSFPAEAQICTYNVPIHNLSYIFKPTTTGTYTYKSGDSDITATTVVY